MSNDASSLHFPAFDLVPAPYLDGNGPDEGTYQAIRALNVNDILLRNVVKRAVPPQTRLERLFEFGAKRRDEIIGKLIKACCRIDRGSNFGWGDRSRRSQEPCRHHKSRREHGR